MPRMFRLQYDKPIYTFEEKENYSVIRNIGANKIQNYVIQKENIPNLISNSETPRELRGILEQYNNKEQETKILVDNKKLNENEKSMEI